MKISVGTHKCEIQASLVNEKEINITECEFEFAEEITNDFVKEAYFTFKDKSYKETIINNKCNIPSEVLEEQGQIELGVVAYLLENNTEIKRYNPSPVYFISIAGSYKGETQKTVKEVATNWGNSIATMGYYLAGNWGDPEPYNYTYEQLINNTDNVKQTINAGITDMQTAKYKLNQTIGMLAQKGLQPSKTPSLQGDRIGEFVDALISQLQKLG